MTMTNDERREMADGLRYVAEHGAPEWATTACCIAECIGEDDYPLWNGSGLLFSKLADLIDPDRDLTCEWVSVDDRLPDCKGEYIVAYHPCCWDNVKYDKVLVGMDSFTGKSSWYRRKYQRVTHWMPKPEPPRAKVVAE